MDSKYIDYLEKTLGGLEMGWYDGDPVKVVKFSDGPFDGAVTFMSLGLSNTELGSYGTVKKYRQEVVLVARRDFGERNISRILSQITTWLLDHTMALLRGDVLGPNGVMFEGTHMEAFYVSQPAYHPEHFYTYDDGLALPIIHVMLVPITAKEAEFVRLQGWSAFEDMLVELDPDLTDFFRESLV